LVILIFQWLNDLDYRGYRLHWLETLETLTGGHQRAKLGAQMPARKVTVCEDETHHPEICLVGLEPVSNFILLEQYAPDRSAATWNEALARALQDLPVEIVQGTSDEAKGRTRRRRVRRSLSAQQFLRRRP
jgi:hypothetical protein